MRARQRHFNARDAGASAVFDARFIIGLSNGSLISTWSDRSGNGWNATASGTARPTYSTNSFGGNAGLQFNGTVNSMNISSNSFALFQNVSGGMLMGVAIDSNPSGGAASHLICSWFTNASPNTRIGIFTRLTSVGITTGGRRLDADTFASTPLSSSGINSSIITGLANFSGNLITTRQNGTSVGTNTFPSGAGNTSNTASVGATVGGTSVTYFIGKIGLVLAFGSLPSNSVVKRCEQSAAFSFKISCA